MTSSLPSLSGSSAPTAPNRSSYPSLALSFAAKVVPAGRTFLRRMIDLSTAASHLHDKITRSEGFGLDI